MNETLIAQHVAGNFTRNEMEFLYANTAFAAAARNLHSAEDVAQALALAKKLVAEMWRSVESSTDDKNTKRPVW